MGDKTDIQAKLHQEVNHLWATVESQKVTLSEHGLDSDNEVDTKEEGIVSFR